MKHCDVSKTKLIDYVKIFFSCSSRAPAYTITRSSKITMTNAVQRQDKQTFADSFSANKYRPPYTIVALIPAGFSRPIPAFNQCP